MSKQTRGDQPNLGRAAPDSPQPDIDRGPPGVQLIRVDPRSIKWPDKRVRAGWNDSELAGLATSMRTVGQQEPVLAHLWPDGTLEGIGGYNRCLAAIQGGIAEVECLTRPGSHRDTVRMNLASDAKKDNDPWSLVEAAAHAYNDEGFSLDEIADIMNHAPGWVQDCLAIADSSPAVQQYFRDGIMTRGHAVLLARVEDHDAQDDSLRLYLDSAPRWTVPQLEQAMREEPGRDDADDEGEDEGPGKHHVGFEASNEPEEKRARKRVVCANCGAEDGAEAMTFCPACLEIAKRMTAHPDMREGTSPVPDITIRQAANLLAGFPAGAGVAELLTRILERVAPVGEE